jgi:hypothetical protein
MYTSLASQAQSKFLNTPTEIRDAIYAYLISNQIHLFRGEAGIRSSLCIHRDSDGDPDCASELPSRDLKVPSTHIAYARPGASIGDARNMRKRSAERL